MYTLIAHSYSSTGMLGDPYTCICTAATACICSVCTAVLNLHYVVYSKQALCTPVCSACVDIVSTPPVIDVLYSDMAVVVVVLTVPL
jgi:hypothetical protein